MGQQEEIRRSIQSIEVKRQRVVVKDGREKSRDEERREGNKEREGDSSLKRTEQNRLRVIVKDHKATDGGGVGRERLRVSIHS